MLLKRWKEISAKKLTFVCANVSIAFNHKIIKINNHKKLRIKSTENIYEFNANSIKRQTLNSLTKCIVVFIKIISFYKIDVSKLSDFFFGEKGTMTA